MEMAKFLQSRWLRRLPQVTCAPNFISIQKNRNLIKKKTCLIHYFQLSFLLNSKKKSIFNLFNMFLTFFLSGHSPSVLKMEYLDGSSSLVVAKNDDLRTDMMVTTIANIFNTLWRTSGKIYHYNHCCHI